MNKIFTKQLINDYHITNKKLRSRDHVFTVNRTNNTFSFRNSSDLSIFINHGRLFVRSDDEDLIKVLEKHYKDYPGEWFTEAKNMDKLRNILKRFSMKIDNTYPLMTPRDDFKRLGHHKFTRIGKEDISSFKGQSAHTFLFNDDDKLGLAYYDGGRIIALAGTSYDGLFTDEIGVEKFSGDDKYKGIGTSIVNELAYLTLKENEEICPIYTTQFSHNGSINLAMRAGFKMSVVISASRTVNKI